MDDLTNRLIAFTIDWNGSPMSDEAPTLTDVSCGLMRHAADAIESLRAENAHLTEERDALALALQMIARGKYDGLEAERFSAIECRVIASAALAKVKREPYEFSGWVEVVEDKCQP